MRNIFIALGLLAAAPAVAQVGVEKIDSFEMGNTYLNDVYYNLLDGNKATQATNNWHIAFRVGMVNDGIRINSATASGANNGKVTVYVYPNGKVADWATFDATGHNSWDSLENSDETWEIGALNTTTGTFPDFGWGVYNPQNHVVTGDSLYLIKYILQGNEVLKKLWIVKKDAGDWHFKFADVDGNNEETVVVKSSDHAGKNYIYYNFETKAVVNREPAEWDFVQTRYNAYQPNNTYAAATGILTNIGVWVALAEGKDADDLELADTAAGFGFTDAMNAIGYEWKYYVMNPDFSVDWFVVDSQAYFIQDLNGILWKVVFTKFGGASSGKTVFSKTQLTPGTGIRDNGAALVQTALYPNPTQGNTQLVITAESNANAVVNVLDMNGKVVYTKEVNQPMGMQVINLNLDTLVEGVYFVNVSGDGFKSTQKLIKY